MPRKQVLVQLDDDLVTRLDATASAIGVSRSELVRRAAIALLDAFDELEADKKLKVAYRKQPQEMALIEVSTRLAAVTAPPW